MTKQSRRRHSPVQTIRELREAEGMLAAGRSIGQVCETLEVSEATFHRRQNQ